ncbi:MAG: cytochrome c3 family protein [Pseudomonadota bacterium]
MTRKCRFAYVAGLVLGVLSVLGTQSGSRDEPPATSTLAIPVRGPRQKPPVSFSHRVHEQRRVACQRCHHEYQGRRNVWKQGQPVKKCLACHGLSPQARRPDVKNALHRQCKGCHLQLRRQGRQAGPIACRDCHRQT